MLKSESLSLYKEKIEALIGIWLEGEANCNTNHYTEAGDKYNAHSRNIFSVYL
ncbi:hypothetical protein [Leptospira meyeri]|uniref:hypothetical protein n=1 Tax=Leptospira meyeri TaxID=29508 RepID=UPI001438320F|nr:hypothetical protein [Leptospira meyeri]